MKLNVKQIGKNITPAALAIAGGVASNYLEKAVSKMLEKSSMKEETKAKVAPLAGVAVGLLLMTMKGKGDMMKNLGLGLVVGSGAKLAKGFGIGFPGGELIGQNKKYMLLNSTPGSASGNRMVSGGLIGSPSQLSFSDNMV